MDKQILNNLHTQTKRESVTEGAKQSTFLPILERADTEIKQIIITGFWLLTPKHIINEKIKAIIDLVDNELPQDLINRQDYIEGMKDKSKLLMKKYFVKMYAAFMTTSMLLMSHISKQVEKGNLRKWQVPKLGTPKDLAKVINSKGFTNTYKISQWAEQKGSVVIKDYAKKVKFMIKDMSKEQMTAGGISIWQKAELDIRYQHQMQMIQDLKDEGKDLCWISSHLNCSARCEKLQGKLVSLTEHAPNPQKEVKTNDFKDLDITTYRIRREGSNWVYSLPDILATKTRGGWHNMIIGGFNCRHKLIPYVAGQPKPKQYDSGEVARQRNIEYNIRAMERDIRSLKQDEKYFLSIGEDENASYTHNLVIKRTEQYKRYCKKNGYAWYQYRIMI